MGAGERALAVPREILNAERHDRPGHAVEIAIQADIVVSGGLHTRGALPVTPGQQPQGDSRLRRHDANLVNGAHRLRLCAILLGEAPGRIQHHRGNELPLGFGLRRQARLDNLGEEVPQALDGLLDPFGCRFLLHRMQHLRDSARMLTLDESAAPAGKVASGSGDALHHCAGQREPRILRQGQALAGRLHNGSDGALSGVTPRLRCTITHLQPPVASALAHGVR